MMNGRSTTLSGGHHRTGTTVTGGLLPGPRLPFSVTFVRRLDTPFPLALDRFDEWWRVASWRDGLDVSGSRLIGPPGLGDDGDERRLGVLLGRGTVQAPVPMDLHVTQWSAS